TESSEGRSRFAWSIIRTASQRTRCSIRRSASSESAPGAGVPSVTAIFNNQSIERLLRVTRHSFTMSSADDFPAVELHRASDAVSRALVDGIRAGLAPVGSKRPKDSELARAFGVSRAGVREALDVLRRAGIVEMRRGHLGGVFVRSLVIPTELLTDRTSLVLAEVRQLLEARRAVETTCA